MKTVTAAIIAGLLTVSLARAGEPPKSEEKKPFYAIGASVGRSLPSSL